MSIKRVCGNCAYYDPEKKFCKLLFQPASPDGDRAEKCVFYSPRQGDPVFQGELKTRVVIDKLPSPTDIPAKTPASNGDPQLLQTVVEFVNIDWEEWRKTEDFEVQYQMILDAYEKLGRGVLEGEFETYARAEVTRYLPQNGWRGNGGEEDIDVLWNKLKANVRAEIIARFLLKKRLISAVAITKSEKEYYVMYGYNNQIIDMETWGKDLLTLLFGRFISNSAMKDVERTLKATARIIPEERLNPRNMIRLKSAVLDLETLNLVRLEEVGDYYFNYAMPVFTNKSNLDHLKLAIREIAEDRYNIETNKVYQYFRPRFEDEDWEYLTTGLGVILSPYKAKLLMILIGEPHTGKSTFLSIIRKPIEPLVSSVSLADLQRYEFGLEPLLGKSVWITSEKSEIYISRAEKLNQIFGESDAMDVARKHKSHARLYSLKLGIMAMNEPPVIEERATGAVQALLERISIITMIRPQDSQNVKGLVDMVSPEEAFNFLLWCRRQLEKNNWTPKKLPAEEVLNILRENSNTAYKFLEEETSLLDYGEGLRIKAKELYDMYVRWCERKGVKPMSRNLFYSKIRAKGYETYEREGVTWVKGIGKKGSKADSTLYELSKYEG